MYKTRPSPDIPDLPRSDTAFQRSLLWVGSVVLLALALPMIMGMMTGAFAADGDAPSKPEHASEALFLIQVMTLILLGRVLGEIMQRIGQPSVMGQLIAGLILGPSVLGVLWPEAQHWLFPKNPAQKAMLDGVSQIGVLLLLLLAGMETDLKLVRRVGRAAFSVSLTGIVLPFICGFALGQVLPEALLPHPEARTVASLFLGTALSISSVKIVAMVVREMNFMRRNVGQVILASAVIDDTVGWIIIAITFSIAEHGTLDLPSLARSVIGTLLFVGASLTVGRRIVFWLIRWTNDSLVSEVPVISMILLIMGAMALITNEIGVHTVLGAFMAGILVGESPILTRQIDMQLRGLIIGLFAPVFFGAAGLSADLTILADPRLAGLTAALVAIASVGKFSGAFMGGKMGQLSARESLALACGMNARGSTEVIVATIGLSIGILSNDLFTMIVAMAIITTMAMPPMLRWALARLPLRDEEKARLEREEFEAKGFLPKVERILLAVDDSANAKFAARLTGMIAGGRGRPTTVLHVGVGANGDEPREAANGKTPTDANGETSAKIAALAEKLRAAVTPKDAAEETARAGTGAATADTPETAEETVKAAAKTTTHVEESEEENPKPAHVDVSTTKAEEQRPDQAVAAEALKGYDLLVLGIGNTEAERGTLHRDVARLAASFEGPLAVVVGRGEHLARPSEKALRILLPVNGTPVAHHAAEVAVALARAARAPIHVLFVTATGANGDRPGVRSTRTRRREEAVLKDIVAMAERYDVAAKTKVCVDVAPDDAILRETRTNADLIVMGVHRRSGDTLFFGDTAARVLAKGKASVLFIST
jgi:Kef-type K+ transport system membrane component KefB/nucleotide-binding universal stress UspA family protein